MMILVTGAAGFIGYHTSRALLERGDTVNLYHPLQPGDVPETHSDISDLSRDTGYQPRFSVEEGVRRFVKWYRWYYEV